MNLFYRHARTKQNEDTRMLLITHFEATSQYRPRNEIDLRLQTTPAWCATTLIRMFAAHFEVSSDCTLENVPWMFRRYEGQISYGKHYVALSTFKSGQFDVRPSAQHHGDNSVMLVVKERCPTTSSFSFKHAKRTQSQHHWPLQNRLHIQNSTLTIKRTDSSTKVNQSSQIINQNGPYQASK